MRLLDFSLIIGVKFIGVDGVEDVIFWFIFFCGEIEEGIIIK